MRILHKFCGLFLLLLLIFIGLACVNASGVFDRFEMGYVSELSDVVKEMLSDPLFLLHLGIVVLTLTVVYLLSFSTRSGRAVYLTYKTETGRVQVNMGAASSYLSKLKKEFAAVVSLTPKLRVRGQSVVVTMLTGIKAGTRIPELSDMLQRRVKECLTTDLGIRNVQEVRIVIKEISGSPPSRGTNKHDEIIDIGVDEEDDRPVIDLDMEENKEDEAPVAAGFYIHTKDDDGDDEEGDEEGDEEARSIIDINDSDDDDKS